MKRAPPLLQAAPECPCCVACALISSKLTQLAVRFHQPKHGGNTPGSDALNMCASDSGVNAAVAERNSHRHELGPKPCA
jgi:hypothetical protein